MKYFILWVLSGVVVLSYHCSLAQAVERIGLGGIQYQKRVNERTPIFDKITGKQIPYQEFEQLMKTDRDGYHLEAIFDEYGQASAYKLRPTTVAERETHRFNDRDPTLRPKVGEPMPEFVMKGVDDKVYRLTDLRGHIIVLSFWISLKKPFWGPSQAKSFSDVVRPYQSETDPISLGILQESKEDIVSVIATETLPFVAIPNSYGFIQKFHITRGSSFIVIDRVGNVAGFVDGSNYDQLKQVLQAVNQK